MRIVLFCVLAVVASLAQPSTTHAAPIEYETTSTWWTKRGIATEGNPIVAFALPALSGTQMLGLLTLVCPRQSKTGAFLEIPMTVYPGADLKGKRVGMIIGVNSQAFAGFVDDNRFLVYLNAPGAPPLPNMKPGTSVRAALVEAKGAINVRLDPARSSGVIVKPASLETKLPALADWLRGQGLQPTSLEQALKECDTFMKGGN
jgi:hypothetical protein